MPYSAYYVLWEETTRYMLNSNSTYKLENTPVLNDTTATGVVGF